MNISPNNKTPLNDAGLVLPLPKTVATHNNKFHSDDVCGVALLQLLNPEITVLRSRDEKDLEKCDLVFDVGMKFDPQNRRFDHHQNDAPVRKNGIKYCGFGQLWDFYGLRLCNNIYEVWEKIDREFVMQIDAEDNGVKLFIADSSEIKDYEKAQTYDISAIISDFNPPNDPENTPTPTDYDRRFFEAVKFVQTILTNLINTELIKYKGKMIAREIIEKRQYPEYAVFETLLSLGSLPDDYPELLYSISFNAAADNWKILALNNSETPFTNRLSFPEEWGGLRDEELQHVSGVKTAVFCHQARFLMVVKTKEDAIKAVNLSLKQIK